MLRLSYQLYNFNPLHREGGDNNRCCRGRSCTYFNPLHREGGDKEGTQDSSGLDDFNPLHREGGDTSVYRNTIPSGIFQSTPPRGWRRDVPVPADYLLAISIHSTARVETAILHNNHYYSSSHFHKQIISHPPQITANHPCTLANPFSLCKFSGANPPVNPCLLQVRTKILYTALPPAARSEYQRFFHINPLIHPNMVHFCSVFIPKVVKPKAVRLFINYICQYRL